MPNKHAAIKALRKNRRQATVNARIKTNVKSLYNKGISLVKSGKKAEAKEVALKFQQAVDKAAKLNILSPNAASRKKSTLMRALNAA